MSKPKAATSKGIMLFKDYELLFDLISDEELGKVIRLLLKNFDNGKLKKQKNFENKKIEKVYTYVSNRIFDYLKKAEKASIDGKKGGNPTLKGRVKGEVKDTLNGGVKLKEGKGRERNGKEYLSLKRESTRESEIPEIILSDKHIYNPRAYWKSLSDNDRNQILSEQMKINNEKIQREKQVENEKREAEERKKELEKPLNEQWTKEKANKFVENMIKFQGKEKTLNSKLAKSLIEEFNLVCEI